MLGGLFKGLKDLIYPNCCLVCKNRILPDREESICENCWEKIEKNLPPFCSTCGRHLNTEAIKKGSCPNCSKSNFYFDRAFSPCIYTGTIKKLIHEFKYSGKDYLGSHLGQLMNEFIRNYRLPIEYLDFIIPVPLHRSRQRQREFNQAEILSQQIGSEFNKKILSDLLIRFKQTKTQAELDFQKRGQNIKDCFRITKPELVKGTNLMLVDDVLTSGATSNEAARCLKDAGALKVILFTLAS